MTVRELIAKLQQMPQDAMVCGLDERGSREVLDVIDSAEVGENVVDLALSEELFNC